MLAKANRLTKQKDIENVLKKGKTKFAKSLGVKYIKNDLYITRTAFIVSTKISKKATKRNRLKRKLREIIRQEAQKIKKGYDFIVLTKKEALEQEYKELEKELKGLLKTIKLI